MVTTYFGQYGHHQLLKYVVGKLLLLHVHILTPTLSPHMHNHANFSAT
jgi:hypothetical protein